MDRLVGGDQRRALRGEVEFVQVRLQAVTRVHGRDRLVGAVVDVVVAAAVALDELALPPGQDGLAFVLLHAQVRRLDAGRQRFEPHERAVRFEDHRAVLARAGRRGEEDVARRRVARRHGDVHGGRGQVVARMKALHVRRAVRRAFRGRFARQRVQVRDREAVPMRRRDAPDPTTAVTVTCSPSSKPRAGRKLAPVAVA